MLQFVTDGRTLLKTEPDSNGLMIKMVYLQKGKELMCRCWTWRWIPWGTGKGKDCVGRRRGQVSFQVGILQSELSNDWGKFS